MFALLNTVVDGENSVTGDVACVARTDCCEPQSSAAATERDERKDMDIGRGREQDDGFVRNGLMPNSDASCVLCRRRRQTKTVSVPRERTARVVRRSATMSVRTEKDVPATLTERSEVAVGAAIGGAVGEWMA